MGNPFDFDRDFGDERGIGRIGVVVVCLMISWLVFLMGAIGAFLWLAGRSLGAW